MSGSTAGMEVRPDHPALDRVVVRAMTTDDIGGAVALERAVHRDPWPAGVLAAELAEASRRYMVAVYGGAMVAFGGTLLAIDEVHVTTLVVDPRHHRRKLASHILLTLLEDAVGRGAAAATLEVRVTNRGAQRLYTTFGFAPVGVRPGYYERPAVGEATMREDGIIMWAYDINGPTYAGRLDEQRRRLRLPGGSSGAPDLPVPHVTPRNGLAGTTSHAGVH